MARQDESDARAVYAEDLGIVWAVMPFEAAAQGHACLDVPHFVLVALFDPIVVELLGERGEDVETLRARAEVAPDPHPRGGAPDGMPFEVTTALEALFHSAYSHMISETSLLSLGHVLQSLGEARPGDTVASALAAIGAEHVVRSLVARVARTPIVTSTVAREAGYRAGAGACRQAILFDHDRVPMDLVTHLLTDIWRLSPIEARMLMMRVHVAGSAEVVLASDATPEGDVQTRTTAALEAWGTPLRVAWRS